MTNAGVRHGRHQVGSFTGQLGAVLLGEGIETEAERETLLDLGVRLGQGYLFGTPGPAENWTLSGPAPVVPRR